MLSKVETLLLLKKLFSKDIYPDRYPYGKFKLGEDYHIVIDWGQVYVRRKRVERILAFHIYFIKDREYQHAIPLVSAYGSKSYLVKMMGILRAVKGKLHTDREQEIKRIKNMEVISKVLDFINDDKESDSNVKRNTNIVINKKTD